MLNPNRLGLMEQSKLFLATELSQIASFIVASGTIGTNMEMGIDVNSDSAEVVGTAAGVTADRTLVTNTPVQMKPAIAGGGVFEQIGTSGIVGCKLNTDGDSLSGILNFDWNEVDFRHQPEFSVLWATGSTTIADTVSWKIHSKNHVPNSSNIVGTGLSTVTIADDNALAAANILQETARGILASTMSNTSRFLQVQVEMDTKAGGLDEDIYLIGLVLYYTSRWGRALQKKARRFARSQD